MYFIVRMLHIFIGYNFKEENPEFVHLPQQQSDKINCGLDKLDPDILFSILEKSQREKKCNEKLL